MTDSRFDGFLAATREIGDLNAAASVLHWDQTTYMPPRGAAGRGRQLATLSRLAQARTLDPEYVSALNALRKEAESWPEESFERLMVESTARHHEQTACVPAEFIGELVEHRARSYGAWTAARPKNDFASLVPVLEKTLELSRRYADFFPGAAHVADPHIDRSDEGMTVATVEPLFAELRTFLVDLVARIADEPTPDMSFLHRHYPESAQIAMGESVIADFGFDFEGGRQDKSAHPFATRFSAGDVRITTRVDERDPRGCLFGTFHECGHAMYEMGVNPDYDGLPMGHGVSSGVHESQSRLWENMVGRSRAFWEHRYAALQSHFPEALGDVSLDAFYRAINAVRPSLIRVEADEVTYNLHILIRFQLELDLLTGALAVVDLPDAWRAHYTDMLGVAASDDQDGCLQDVHWFSGMIGGAFQGYTLGNVLAAQFFERARAEHPEVDDEIAAGTFGTLRGWLQSAIYRHGGAYPAPELIRRAAGGDIDLDPYRRYITGKFGPLYGLEL